jgi:hypothetical protein
MRHVRHVSGEKFQATYMPKSAITISDDGSLVRKRMFSGLFTSHELDPEITPKIDKVKVDKVNDRGEGRHT